MNIFRYQYLLFLIGVICLAFISLGFLIVKKDWETKIPYANEFLPINWPKYYFDIQIRKNYQTFLGNKEYGLPSVNLVVPEKAIKALQAKVPDSIKKWQRAFVIRDDGNLKNIRIRFRGDNTTNWALNKKSYRVRINKKNYTGGIRTKDYIPPSNDRPFVLNHYATYFLSKSYGLLTPEFKFVELNINGKNQGVYYEIEKADEGFLRRNNVMPVNLYKGEMANNEALLGNTDTNLFINPGIWKKLSVFNLKELDNKKDLEYLLNQLKLFENNLISPDFFFSKFPLDYWSKFALTGGQFHSGNTQNQRLISDTWRGWAIPIIQDPLSNDFLFKHEIEEVNDDLERILNLDPMFVMKKYINYYDYVFKKRIYDKFADHLVKIKLPLLISAHRDYNNTNEFYFDRTHSGWLTKGNIAINNAPLKNHIENFIDKLRLSTKLNNIFIKKINATWFQSQKALKITLNDKLPLGKIKINFKEKNDLNDLKIIVNNKNKFFKKQNISFKIINNKSVILNTTLVADRTQNIIDTDHMLYSLETNIKPTTFIFNLNKNFTIDTIEGLNIFSQKYQDLNFSSKIGLAPSKNNYVITKNVEKKTTVLSGELNFENTKVFYEKVIIKPGTKIFLGKNVNLIFKNQLLAEGNNNEPINILPLHSQSPWGTFAIIGSKTDGSKLNHIIFKDGSGGSFENIYFTGMISIHNSKNMIMENLKVLNNHIFDDMIHAVYADNLQINNIILKGGFSDQIDIDISKNVKISEMQGTNAINDCLDFMQTTAYVEKSYFNNCGDKGVSVGEASTVKIKDSVFSNNYIGIQSKDKSNTIIENTEIKNNKTAFSAKAKNWRYGGGGKISIKESIIRNNKLLIEKDSKSQVIIN